jgi:anti-anti-sigma factor
MSIDLEETEKGNLVVLQGTIDICCAAELKTVLLRAFSAGTDLQVSVADAAYLDVTAVQLLWAADEHARRSGVKFRISGAVPDSVSAALAEAGFPSFPASVSAG